MMLSTNERRDMGALSQLIDSFLQQGKYHFTTEEVSSALGLEGSAVRQSLRRLRRKRRIASPQRGFHVVVPPEYRALGCLPPEQFVPQLLDQSGEPYHVTLLSAAQLHGAAHQRPQRFQVMVAKPRRTITCGAVNVDFFVLGDIESVSTTVMNTPRGLLQVASPEATAIELVGYQKHAGGLDNVATVLSELAETLSSSMLAAEATRFPVAWAQRLGYLLDLVEQHSVTDPLLEFVEERARRIAPLEAALPRKGAPRSQKWKLAINSEVEPDL
jgi:predicted transcriptional regulator of viral defense system